MRPFERMSPEPGWPVWKCELAHKDSPLQTLIFGQKRHTEFIETDAGPELVAFTETNLGGQFLAPPAMANRADDGHYDWSRAICAA